MVLGQASPGTPSSLPRQAGTAALSLWIVLSGYSVLMQNIVKQQVGSAPNLFRRQVRNTVETKSVTFRQEDPPHLPLAWALGREAPQTPSARDLDGQAYQLQS